MSIYNPIDVLVKNPYGVIIPLFLSFNSIYIGLRYFKTGKLSYSEYMSKDSSFKLHASISIFIGILITLFFFHEFTKEKYFGTSTGILVDFLWFLFLITFFYWYWNSKKEPFQLFHWEQEYLEDSKKDKKKQKISK